MWKYIKWDHHHWTKRRPFILLTHLTTQITQIPLHLFKTTTNKHQIINTNKSPQCLHNTRMQPSPWWINNSNYLISLPYQISNYLCHTIFYLIWIYFTLLLHVSIKSQILFNHTTCLFITFYKIYLLSILTQYNTNSPSPCTNIQ